MKISELIEKLEAGEIGPDRVNAIIRDNPGILSRTSLGMMHAIMSKVPAEKRDKGMATIFASCLRTEIGEVENSVVDLGTPGKPQFFKSDRNSEMRKIEGLNQITLDTEVRA